MQIFAAINLKKNNMITIEGIKRKEVKMDFVKSFPEVEWEG